MFVTNERHSSTRIATRVGAVLAAGTLVLAACGSDDEAEPAPDTTEAPAEEPDEEPAPETTEAPAEEPAPETTDAPADESLRVVSLSPTHTEMMFAIGAGDQLVAVDTLSNYPAEAADLPNELSAFEPSVEAIAAFEPDLVLIGGDFTGLGAQLDELDIGWWDGPTASSLDDVYTQIEQLGAATGQVGEAAELVAQMQGDIDAIVAEAGGAGDGLSFYHEIDATLFSADSSTFIGQIYGLLGLTNVADADETESFGFPQLNAEFLIDQNPDLIFLPTGTFYFETAEGVSARDGWDAIAAVQNGNIFETDDEIAGRWGPRIVDYLAEVAAAVETVAVSAGG